MKFRSSILLSLLLFSMGAYAGPKEVAEKFERNSGIKVISISKSKYFPSLYEAKLENLDTYFLDEDANFYSESGEVFNTKTAKKIENSKLQRNFDIDFSWLPLNNAIKIVRGTGEKKIAIFEDPNCKYCKKLHAALASMTNVTIFVILYPILSSDSYLKAKHIYCAPLPSKTWEDWIERTVPISPANPCDTTAIDKTIELGRELNIAGTPTTFLANGKRITGANSDAIIQYITAPPQENLNARQSEARKEPASPAYEGTMIKIR